jgi:hypothetical protein
MLQFDRFKITTSIHNITVQQNNSFIKVINRDGELIYSTFSSKIPSIVRLRIDHIHETAYLEFTAKILGDHYPKLITGETLQEAFSRIEQRCDCVLNKQSILDDARVLLADVTKDIPIPMNDQLKQSLYMSVSNTKKWRPEIREQNGIDVKKFVKNNSKCRERLSLYCKSTELLLSRNKPFIESLNNPQVMLSQFMGKTRVEYNLSSSYMIMKALEIDNTLLQSVLGSKANPLLNIFKRIFDPQTLPDGDMSLGDYQTFKKIGDYHKHLLLKEFNDDTRKVEQVYRHFYSPRSNFRTKRKELVRIRNLRHANTISPISNREILTVIENKLN